jgi:phosphoribosylaminoimidazole-succinocarboxamide synthase
MTRGQFIRKKVSENLNNVRKNSEFPGLAGGKQGKVRHLYSSRDAHGQKILIMSTSDRVSAFDVVLDRAVPYKGIVLNAITSWSFDQTEDIIPNAFLRSPNPYIMIQKELANIGFECVVRGYMWGSLAADYEGGLREKCGTALEDGLLRYQKLQSPLFTPTTKAQTGHDVDVHPQEMAARMQENLSHKGIEVHGEPFARQVRDISLRLYQRGDELAQRTGLSLVDTKYEFGLDPSGRLHLIDEVHTPDSSRYVDSAEWKEKWTFIKAKMENGGWPNVTQLLREHPELKVKELSKQLVRDVLIESGYDPNMRQSATLHDEAVIETAARYIELYERLTGNEFEFPDENLLLKSNADSWRDFF